MKLSDKDILIKAKKLQMLATADYNALFNSLDKSESNDKILANLYDELEISKKIQEIYALRFDSEQPECSKREVKEFVDNLSMTGSDCL